MIDQSTVFILGAGAGVPYGFPTGAELTKEIYTHIVDRASSPTGPQPPFGPFPKGDAVAFAEALRASGFLVDLWLATNPSFVEMGKWFITRAIMLREDPNRFLAAQKSGSDWYGVLWQRMFPTSKKIEDIAKNQVTLVTFNYDRSLEASLMLKARNTFIGAKEDECAEVLSQIPIIHVHGQIGRVPWQPNSGMAEREYSTHVLEKDIVERAKHVRIISETDGETAEYKLAKERLKSARYVHFLGFGYHEDNLERLRVEGYENPKMATPRGTYKGVEGWKIGRLRGKDNPFGYPIDLSHAYEDVVDYANNMIEGWGK